MMPTRPLSLTLAAALLLMIGASAVLAGGSLLGAATSGPVAGVDIRGAALGLGLTIGGYGVAAFLAGLGLLWFRRWAWRLGLVTIAFGLVANASALTAAGPDLLLTVGLVLWGVTLGCLAASTTRQAVADAADAAHQRDDGREDR